MDASEPGHADVRRRLTEATQSLLDGQELQAGEWLLNWCALRIGSRDGFPRLELRSSSGYSLAVGTVGPTRPVSGSAPALLGWLTGRPPPEVLDGVDGLVLPAF